MPALATDIPGVQRVLPPAQWQELKLSHEREVATRTQARQVRAAAGQKHPVEDFLYTYYPFKPGQIARWHPGLGTGLRVTTPEQEALFHRRWYSISEGGEADQRQRIAHLDLELWLEERGSGLEFIAELLGRTLAREGAFGCFGLHEWAMVYREDEHRHRQLPLRLSQEATDAVVDNHRIKCSHFDAFRFFTPAAVGLNELQPARESMPEWEQPGCLHAGMDLYKWAMKLGPLIDSNLLLAAFDHARGIRVLDMEASPYDVRGLGYGVVPIETPAGKAEYVARQREFASLGQDIRARLVEKCRQAQSHAR